MNVTRVHTRPGVTSSLKPVAAQHDRACWLAVVKAGMPDGMGLCELEDVAVELGVESLSDIQAARAEPLIARLSALFVDVTQRAFAPGINTHRLRVRWRGSTHATPPVDRHEHRDGMPSGNAARRYRLGSVCGGGQAPSWSS